METKTILADLQAERDRIDQAIAAIEALEGAGMATATPGSPRSKPGRNIGSEGRARIAAVARASGSLLKKLQKQSGIPLKFQRVKSDELSHPRWVLRAGGSNSRVLRVATNLAFDELRRHSTWRESMILDLRVATEADQGRVEQSKALIGPPETKAIAREHLVACLACTLRNLPDRKAAALLLKEVHGFSVDEVAKLLDATPAQAKNWLQEARNYMRERYGSTCALLAKSGACYQCVELDGFFAAGNGSPLTAPDNEIDARLKIAAELKERPWGKWRRMVLELVDEIL